MNRRGKLRGPQQFCVLQTHCDWLDAQGRAGIDDSYASALIYQLPALAQPDVKLAAWMRDPQKFPHFTTAVGFYAYLHYDAQRNQNACLDRNRLPDAEQLCFLLDVDAIVSSESRGFMKRAFEALWQPRQRLLFAPEEFVAFLASSAGSRRAHP